MPAAKLEEQIFGNLTVVKRVGNDYNGRAQWLCNCRCGGIIIVTTSRLRYKGIGGVKSCGCCDHKGTHPIESSCWTEFRQRCYNTNNKDYKNYGGRGIRVCNRWKDNFYNFLDDMGNKPDPRMSLDRRDNNGNYEPTNCRWVFPQIQVLNRRPHPNTRYKFLLNKEN